MTVYQNTKNKLSSDQILKVCKEVDSKPGTIACIFGLGEAKPVFLVKGEIKGYTSQYIPYIKALELVSSEELNKTIKI